MINSWLIVITLLCLPNTIVSYSFKKFSLLPDSQFYVLSPKYYRVHNMKTTFQFENRKLTGELHFSLYRKFHLKNKCGDRVMYGQFIFENTKGTTGEPKCLNLTSEINPWDVYPLMSDDETPVINGVKIENEIINIHPLGLIKAKDPPIENANSQNGNLLENQTIPSKKDSNDSNSAQKVIDIGTLNSEKILFQSKFSISLICVEKELMSLDTSDQSNIIFKIGSQSGCPKEFQIPAFLDQFSYFSGIVLLTLGLMFMFYGHQLFKHSCVMFGLTFGSICIFGFILYLLCQTEDFSVGFFKNFTFLAVVIVIAACMIFFNFFFYLVLAGLASMNFGFMTQEFFEESFNIGTYPFVAWILVIIFFILFIGLYYSYRNNMIIWMTSCFGAFFTTYSLKFFKLTTYDIIVDILSESYRDHRNPSAEATKSRVLYFMLVLISVTSQKLFMFWENKEEEPWEIEVDEESCKDSEKTQKELSIITEKLEDASSQIPQKLEDVSSKI